MIRAKECDCNSTVDCRQSDDYINIKWLIVLLNIYCNYENYENYEKLAKCITEVILALNYEFVDIWKCWHGLKRWPNSFYFLKMQVRRKRNLNQ